MEKTVWIKLQKSLLTAFLVLLVLGSTAQVSRMDVSKMSNQEVLLLWQQAQKGGLSESDAIKQLTRSGLSANDINTFKKRLLQAQSSNKNKGIKTGNLIADSAAFMNDSSWVQSVPQMKKISPYYGFDFFSNPDITFEPNLSLNPPKNYVLGPGDALTLNLTGVNETSISDRISRDGNFQVPYAGIVNLSGLTLEQAKEKLRAKMSTAYPALASGRTQLFLTIDNTRNITVSIVGEAARPGNFTVSALAGFFNVLYLSGGPSQQGSLRSIELVRNNKLIETIDFYSFLQKGIFNNSIRLEDQDVIRIPVYQKRVTLDGSVKRPAIYELLPKETLADLVNYAGGFEGDAYTETVQVVQVGGKEKAIRDIHSIDFANFIPRNADSVYVGRTLATYANRVVITGAVKRPGNYELTDGLTLAKLIKNADGLQDDAFGSRGYIKRTRPGNTEREQLSFDADKLLKGESTDIALIKNDSVFITSRDNIRDKPLVTVAGNVRQPGAFEFRRGMSVQDAILMAGGFTNDAATHKVEISRLEKNTADTLANQLQQTIRINIDSSLAEGKTLLEPLDYIFVPRLLNYRVLGGVKVRGEVLNPGDYTLERRDETVNELIERAGGVSPYASLANTQVYRNGIRVATTIFASGGNEKFLLLPGDSMYIPRDVPFVEVQGAVFNPQMLRYDTDNFLSYISESGGVKDNGNLRKAYVQYSNGINKRIGHFLFFRNYPKILPGSKIIVPEKSTSEKRGISVIEISALAGVLSALVGMIAVLK